MEEIIIDEQATAQGQTAEAEGNKDCESQASLGKFKSAEALLKAYNSLQTEFTKRCQRIKELEANLSREESQRSPLQTAQGTTPKEISVKEKETILKDYLIEIMQGKSTAIVVDSEGTGVKAPYSKPKSIAEAGQLAKDLLKKQ